MLIAMKRGDAENICFTVLDSEDNPISFKPDNIYFTVKRYADDHDPLIQKHLLDGSIQDMGEGTYQFKIEPKDTNELKFGKYVFDIEVVAAGINIKQTFMGRFVLDNEVTHYYNEGA